jgi:pyridoxal/pyridoxine/pyridoxamine kinase
MAIKQPPNVNGIMDLADTEKADIKAKLDLIISGFVATDEQPLIDTFYIVSNYNKENPDNPINGDTCGFILTPVQEG